MNYLRNMSTFKKSTLGLAILGLVMMAVGRFYEDEARRASIEEGGMALFLLFAILFGLLHVDSVFKKN